MDSQKSMHTPAPWKHGFVRKGKYRGDYAIMPISSVSGECVGPPFCYIAQGRPDLQKANAQLIATAPDLLTNAETNLAVLRNLRDYLVEHADILSSMSLSAILDVRIEATSLWISRARGDE